MIKNSSWYWWIFKKSPVHLVVPLRSLILGQTSQPLLRFQMHLSIRRHSERSWINYSVAYVHCSLLLFYPSKHLLLRWSSGDRSGKNKISHPPHITLPLALAARITRTSFWKFKNLAMRTLRVLGQLECPAGQSVCSFNVEWCRKCFRSQLLREPHHFLQWCRKATASFPSIFYGT